MSVESVDIVSGCAGREFWLGMCAVGFVFLSSLRLLFVAIFLLGFGEISTAAVITKYDAARNILDRQFIEAARQLGMCDLAEACLPDAYFFGSTDSGINIYIYGVANRDFIRRVVSVSSDLFFSSSDIDEISICIHRYTKQEETKMAIFSRPQATKIQFLKDRK